MGQTEGRARGCEIVMNLTIVTKVQLGFSLAAISVMTIGLAELLIHCPPLRMHAELLCGGAGGIGFVMWLGGRLSSKADRGDGNSLAYLTGPRYWGLLLALSALLAYSHSAYRRLQNKPIVPVVAERPVPAARKVVFPPLKLEGVVFQGAKSSALVNGKVVFVGDDVDLVEVVSIQPDHVVMVLEGQTNTIFLRQEAR